MRAASIVLLVVALWGGRVAAQDVSPLVHDAVIAAPAADVWAAFTTGEGLRSWMAPHAEIDLRLGGLMRSNYNAGAPLADAGTISNRILAFEPGRMLALQVADPPRGFPFPTAIQQMWTVLYFEPLDARRTRVRSVALGFGPGEEAQQMRAFFQQGNAATLAQLQKRFMQGSDR